MTATQGRSDDLIDLARVLLVFQGAILVATTIEALLWAAVFPGAAGAPALLSAATAMTILVGRARLRTERRWSRRLLYVVQGVILGVQAIDVVLSLILAGALPPLVALLTQLVLPIAVIAVLRRSTRPAPQAALAGAL